ncbi:MAG: DUF1284 domain-containing protein [Halobacteria archaeon]
MNAIPIRGHHLLCILGFKGIGYSAEFVENLRQIIALLKINPILKIVCECDSICARCPYIKNGRCNKYQRDLELEVKEMDLMVLGELNLKINTELSARHAFELVRRHVDKKDLLEICRNCEFLKLKYCIEGLDNVAKFSDIFL